MNGKVQETSLAVNPPTVLVKQSDTLIDKMAKAVKAKIKTQSDVDTLVELQRAARQWIATWDAHHDPLRKSAYDTWKKIVAAQDNGKGAMLIAVNALSVAINKFLAEQRAEANRKQLELEAKQREENERAAKEQEKLLKRAGADTETINEAKQEALSRPAPIVQPKVEAPSGYSLVERWSVKVENFDALCAALAGDRTLRSLVGVPKVIEAIESALRPTAISQKAAFRVAGCRAEAKTSSSDRGA